MPGSPTQERSRAEAVAAAAVASALERTEGREFATFRCGCALPGGRAHGTTPEDEGFRKDVAARMRSLLEAAWPAAAWDALTPDVVVEALAGSCGDGVRGVGGGARVVVVPVYVAGRYRKIARGISQTVFLCRRCRGRRARAPGCESCGGTGRLCPESVEDFVVPPLVAAVAGRRGSFHGSGREDVDVRMLGRGRPFVVSVEDPRRRALDADAVASEVARSSAGRVEVTDLRVVRRADMARLTTDHGIKHYRALFVPDGEHRFPDDAAARLLALRGADLRQRTPERVALRRADAVREKRVFDVAVEEASPRRIVLSLRTEPGTYVKELVSGDGGRTSPSAAELLGVPCTCEELDVLDVEDGPAAATTAAATAAGATSSAT